MAELLNLVGALIVTAATINYAPLVDQWIRPWLTLHPTIVSFVAFWGFFLIVWTAMRFLLRRAADIVKWEQFHWAIQGLGLVLGAARSVWWSSFILVALSTSGFVSLQQSVSERSILGSKLLGPGQHAIEVVTAMFPGAEHRWPSLVPPIKPGKTRKS